MKRWMAGILMVAAAWPMWTGTVRADGAESVASEPRDVRISLYDAGFGVVSELRRLTLAEGENKVRFHGLPPALDPTTVSFVPVSEEVGFRVRDQIVVYDPSSPERLARHPEREVKGNPTLIWQVKSDREGPQDIRLSYRSDGWAWRAAHEAILNQAGDRAYFGARIAVENATGGRLEDAAIRLVVTERGVVDHVRRSAVTAPHEAAPQSALRYAYGLQEPTFEETVASLAPIHTVDLPRRHTMESGTTRLVKYALAPELPVRRFYVYDGVKFDRFQRHRRNDWNYGTEYHTTVETHLKFQNAERDGLGIDLPPGMFRLYQQRAGGTMDFIGEDFLLPIGAGEEGHVLLGPARGLRGERERTGYVEVTPLREYEETFQIRLENNSEETVEIRVVEHLYRWHEFEIVRADTEYEATGPRTIEFRPTLRPGGRRTIHYTVRYSW